MQKHFKHQISSISSCVIKFRQKNRIELSCSYSVYISIKCISRLVIRWGKWWKFTSKVIYFSCHIIILTLSPRVKFFFYNFSLKKGNILELPLSLIEILHMWKKKKKKKKKTVIFYILKARKWNLLFLHFNYKPLSFILFVMLYSHIFFNVSFIYAIRIKTFTNLLL